jgi:quinol monooxygenase YgiN
MMGIAWLLAKTRLPGKIAMYKFALFAQLEAKPGKENEVAKLLEAGLAMARKESTTPLWFALRLEPTTFGVFDAFADEGGRQTHLNRQIAKAITAKARELFAKAVREPELNVLLVFALAGLAFAVFCRRRRLSRYGLKWCQ